MPSGSSCQGKLRLQEATPGACQRHDASAWCSGPRGPAVPSWCTTAGLEPDPGLAPTGCTVTGCRGGQVGLRGPCPHPFPADGRAATFRPSRTLAPGAQLWAEQGKPRCLQHKAAPRTPPCQKLNPKNWLLRVAREGWQQPCQAGGLRGILAEPPVPGVGTERAPRGCHADGLRGRQGPRGARSRAARGRGWQHKAASPLGTALHPLPLPGRRARRGGAHKGCTDGRAHRGAAAAPRCWL